MAMVTREGFISKTSTEYKEDIMTRMLQIDPSWVIDPATPDGLLVEIQSEYLDILDQVANQVFASRDPLQAIGVALDDLAAINGMLRMEGSNSAAEMTVRGNESAVVPAGTIIIDENENMWSLLADVTNLPNQSAWSSVEEGEIVVNNSSVFTIKTPVYGFDSVDNATVTGPGLQVGQTPESDIELRERMLAHTSLGGRSSIDAVYSHIMEGASIKVANIKIYENNTTVTVNGITPYSVQIIVDGGDDMDIATAIWESLPAGVVQYVDDDVDFDPRTVVVTSPLTTAQYTVRFNRPKPIDVFVKVKINNLANAPTNVGGVIATAIINYSNGTLFDGNIELGSGDISNFNVDGYGIGDNVSSYDLATAINSMLATEFNTDDDVYLASITVGSTASPTDLFVEIPNANKALFTNANIEVVDNV